MDLVVLTRHTGAVDARSKHPNNMDALMSLAQFLFRLGCWSGWYCAVVAEFPASKVSSAEAFVPKVVRNLGEQVLAIKTFRHRREAGLRLERTDNSRRIEFHHLPSLLEVRAMVPHVTEALALFMVALAWVLVVLMAVGAWGTSSLSGTVPKRHQLQQVKMPHSQVDGKEKCHTSSRFKSSCFLRRLVPEALVRSFVGAAEEAIALAGGAQSFAV